MNTKFSFPRIHAQDGIKVPDPETNAPEFQRFIQRNEHNKDQDEVMGDASSLEFSLGSDIEPDDLDEVDDNATSSQTLKPETNLNVLSMGKGNNNVTMDSVSNHSSQDEAWAACSEGDQLLLEAAEAEMVAEALEQPLDSPDLCPNEPESEVRTPKPPEVKGSVSKLSTLFCTGSGKSVRNVKQENLEKVQKLWQENNEPPSQELKFKTESSEQSMNGSRSNADQPSGGFMGFSSARGNKFAISEAALAKARKLWVQTENEEVKVVKKQRKMEEPNIQPSPQKSESETPPVIVGFTNASGKKVAISQTALAKARKLWETTEDDQMPVPSTQQAKIKPIFKLKPDELEKAKAKWEAAGKAEITSPMKLASQRPMKPAFVPKPEFLEKAKSMWEEVSKETSPSKSVDQFKNVPLANPKVQKPVTPRLNLCPSTASSHQPTASSTTTTSTPSSSITSTLSMSKTTPTTVPRIGLRSLGSNRRSMGSLGRFKPPILSNNKKTPRDDSTNDNNGASPSLRASKRPRLAFNAPRASLTGMEKENANDNDSQEFEAQIIDFLEDQEL